MHERDLVTEYALDVASGRIAGVGKLHLAACKRHLKDLKRTDLVWDVAASERVLRFANKLTVLEGAKPRSLKLLPCQAFDIGCTFGWKLQNGNRRFRRRYKTMARQQGKTMENGIMGAYISAFSGYHEGKLFCVATKKRQASLVWDEMERFIRADPDLSQLFVVKTYLKQITAKRTNCTIEALSREGGLDDGFRSIFSSIDEIHQHKDNRIYKAIYNGTRQLPETLVSMITTRGYDTNSFCYEMDTYAKNVLLGNAIADDFFVDMYVPDDGDDPFLESTWIKSNPYSMTTEHGREVLRSDAATARDMGGQDLKDFLVKGVNFWITNTDDTFLDPEHWKACGSGRTLDNFNGQACWAGLDLSSGGDLTTLALEFETENGGVYVWSHSYMPRGRLSEHMQTDLAPYDVWEQEGLITVTGGMSDFKNDYAFIVKELHDIIEAHGLKLQAIGIDPHNADGVLGSLESFGCPVVIIKQTCQTLNDATCDIQYLVRGGIYEHDVRNELMTWSFVNARTVQNSFEEIKVDKKPRQRTKRIDPVDACVDAHAVRMMLAGESVYDYEQEMNNYLHMMGW